MKSYPALDLRAEDTDLLYAMLDDFSPTAIEQREDGLRVFFASTADRDEAAGALASRVDTARVDVPDEDWARRSQENLSPVTVGRVTIVPSAPSDGARRLQPSGSDITVVIQPSMGFGTGHHATTRLCVAALQQIDVAGKRVLDVGTGSGVLAIVASRLGAASAIGIDCDADAIQAARENLGLNPEATQVELVVADLTSSAIRTADIVTANLTGALLVRAARTLLDAAGPDGMLIVSGLMASERDAVCRAFEPATVDREQHEDEWVGLIVKKS